MTDIDANEPTPARAEAIDQGSEPRTLSYHGTAGARPLPAGRIITIGIIAFVLAGLLNADSLHSQASRQPFGWKRDVLRTAVAPVRWVSHTTGLNRPRAWIQDSIGRPPIDGSGTTMPVTTLPPSAPPPAVSLRWPTAARPMQLWVGGDSMAQEIGTSVVEAADARGDVASTLDYRISTGLTRPDYFDWPAHLAREVLPSGPEVIVVMFGANDGQPLEIPPGGPVYAVRTPEWQAEYRQRVAATMDLLGGDGRLVVWVGMPHMRKAEFNERMEILDDIYAAEAARRPWVRFVDTRPLLSAPGGGYADFVTGPGGGQERARQSDGIHLSRFGADLVAAEVFSIIEEELAASPAAAGGEAGVPDTSEPG